MLGDAGAQATRGRQAIVLVKLMPFWALLALARQ